MIVEKDIVAIGKFQKTHALKGELNALLDIDPEYITDGNPIIVDVDGIYVPFYAENIRTKGNWSYLVKLEGVDSEEAAKPFVNKTINALRKTLAEYEAENNDGDEVFFLDDLIGYTLEDSDSGRIGIISDVDMSTENALFIVSDNNGEVLYIPANDNLIEAIDDERKVVTMHLPDGLLSIN